MVYFSCVSTRRSSDCSPPASWKPLGGCGVIVAVAAFALAGCNANQAINPSGQADRCANDPDCNPYNPSSYAQNNVGIGRVGGGGNVARLPGRGELRGRSGLDSASARKTTGNEGEFNKSAEVENVLKDLEEFASGFLVQFMDWLFLPGISRTARP